MKRQDFRKGLQGIWECQYCKSTDFIRLHHKRFCRKCGRQRLSA